MKIRILVAALLGGLTLFAWGGLSHMMLGLGDHGLQAAPPAPGDQALLDSLKATLPASGFYFFPGMDPSKMGDAAVRAEWEERTKSNPHGFIVYNTAPYGGMGAQLGREVIIDIGVALVAAILLSWALGCCATLVGRVGFVTLLGLIVALRPIQQWNWYEFPCNFTCAQVADGVIGFLLLGVVLGLIIKPKGGTPAAS